jgi:hypothetical protein
VFSPSVQDPPTRCSCFGPLFTPGAEPILRRREFHNQSEHAIVRQIKIGLMEPTRPQLASGAIATVDKRAGNTGDSMRAFT